MAYPTSGLLGVNLSATYASAGALPMAVNTRVNSVDGGVYQLVKALSAVGQFDAVALLVQGSATTVFDMQVAPLTTTNATKTRGVAFAQTAIAVGEYGWVALEGANLRVKVATACEPEVPLFTTATGGVLDDATVSASNIAGVFVVSSAASASAPGAIAVSPHIARFVTIT